MADALRLTRDLVQQLVNAGVTYIQLDAPRYTHLVSEVGVSNFRRLGIDPDTWLSRATAADGSWWPAWAAWLETKSDAERVAPPRMGAPSRELVPLCPAPGLYVYQR